jgi:hypothetical protein
MFLFIIAHSLTALQIQRMEPFIDQIRIDSTGGTPVMLEEFVRRSASFLHKLFNTEVRYTHKRIVGPLLT